MKVGLVDSGIGGWSFLTKIRGIYPHHTYVYFADQKNCPFGNKSVEELNRIADYWIEVFKLQKLDVLVIACNTMTAWFKERFKKELNIPVLGTTDGLEEVGFTGEGAILLATVSTVKSKWYEKHFQDIEGSIGNSWLAATIEKSFVLKEEECTRLKNEIESALGTNWDLMILGCTHYPLVKKQLMETWADKKFVDPADTIIEKLKKLLDSRIEINNNIIMYTTGELKLFKKQVDLFFTEEKKQILVSELKINNKNYKGALQ